MNEQRVQIHVSGRVQGVFYRMCAREEAGRLGLTGWIRNCRDGSVEAVAEGPRQALDEFVAWCRRGSPAASVTGVKLEWSSASGEFSGFRVSG